MVVGSSSTGDLGCSSLGKMLYMLFLKFLREGFDEARIDPGLVGKVCDWRMLPSRRGLGNAWFRMSFRAPMTLPSSLASASNDSLLASFRICCGSCSGRGTMELGLDGSNSCPSRSDLKPLALLSLSS